MTLGEYIKKLRKENNLTQNKLALKMGATLQSVKFWETGRQIPRINNLKRLSYCLHAPLQTFKDLIKEK